MKVPLCPSLPDSILLAPFLEGTVVLSESTCRHVILMGVFKQEGVVHSVKGPGLESHAVGGLQA